MKTPFRRGFRKGVIAAESIRFRLYTTTPIHRPPERAISCRATMVKTGRVMELTTLYGESACGVKSKALGQA